MTHLDLNETNLDGCIKALVCVIDKSIVALKLGREPKHVPHARETYCCNATILGEPQPFRPLLKVKYFTNSMKR